MSLQYTNFTIRLRDLDIEDLGDKLTEEQLV